MLTAATRGKTCQVAVKSRVPKLHWDDSLHGQGLTGLLEKGAGLAACDRFLDVGGDVGKTLKVKRVFPAKPPAQGRVQTRECKGQSWKFWPVEGMVQRLV